MLTVPSLREAINAIAPEAIPIAWAVCRFMPCQFRTPSTDDRPDVRLARGVGEIVPQAGEAAELGRVERARS